MKLLVINPNTTRAMTDAVVAEVKRCVGINAQVTGVTATFGHEVIANRASFVVGAHAALDAWRQHAAGADAVILACFGDPGLAALRESASIPVIGLAEASILHAEALGHPYSIVTAGAAWGPMLREAVLLNNGSALFHGVIVIEATGLDIARDAAAFQGRVQSAVDAAVATGARTVILGGAGFAGMAAGLRTDATLIDCIACATTRAQTAVEAH